MLAAGKKSFLLQKTNTNNTNGNKVFVKNIYLHNIYPNSSKLNSFQHVQSNSNKSKFKNSSKKGRVHTPETSRWSGNMQRLS